MRRRSGWVGRARRYKPDNLRIFSIILNAFLDRSSPADELQGRLVQASRYERIRAQAFGKRVSRTLMH